MPSERLPFAAAVIAAGGLAVAPFVVSARAATSRGARARAAPQGPLEPRAAGGDAGGHATSAAPILARNPFDSRTGPLDVPACPSLASADARSACEASRACAAAGFPHAPPCVTRSGPHAYDVTRAMVDHVLEQQAELHPTGRFVPELDDAQRVVGVRLLGVRPGTGLAAIGIENGDLLRAVNGHDVADPSRALEAYAKLRDAPVLRIGLVRRGVPVTITLRIR